MGKAVRRLDVGHGGHADRGVDVAARHGDAAADHARKRAVDGARVRAARSAAAQLEGYALALGRAAQREVLGSLSFGGGCVNDTIIHLATTEMGFGGVGASGMGAYHGRKSFDTFTHEKSVVHRGAFPDVDARYHPYTEKKEKLVRSLLH